MQISQVQQLLLSPPPLKRPMPFEQPQPPFLPSFPQPLPKMARRTMIQIRLQPQPLPLWGLVQPQSLEQLQFVAVKSLMFLTPYIGLCFILCGEARFCFSLRKIDL
jgi:hypothetical protein